MSMCQICHRLIQSAMKRNSSVQDHVTSHYLETINSHLGLTQIAADTLAVLHKDNFNLVQVGRVAHSVPQTSPAVLRNSQNTPVRMCIPSCLPTIDVGELALLLSSMHVPVSFLNL